MPQAQTVALPKRLPLVLDPQNRGESTAYDARLVNCYMETRKQGEEVETWIYERPGMDEQSRPPAGNATGRGLFNWRGNIYSIFGDRLYVDGVVVAGTVDTTNGVYRFDSCLGATPRLQLGNGVEAYNYDAGGGLVNISDGDFPSAFRKGWAFLNGTSYVLTAAAHILGDDINDPTAWDPLNDILAHIEPDQGVALAKQLVYAIALKQWSVEAFYDAGNSAGSPLGRVEGAKVNFGCIHQDSVRDVDGDLLWASVTQKGPAQIAMMSGLKAEIVSTKAVERLLASVNFSTETVYSWGLKIAGHKFYILTCVTANLTLAFDIRERMWSQWTDTSGNYLPIVDSCTTAAGVNLVQHASNGRIYTVSDDYATDDGDLIQVDLYTPNFDGGTRRRKQMTMLKLISDQQVGTELLVRTNDHDYDSTKWSTFRKLYLSQKDPFITDCGTFVRRVHNFRHRQPIRMPRIQAVEMQLDLGTL